MLTAGPLAPVRQSPPKSVPDPRLRQGLRQALASGGVTAARGVDRDGPEGGVRRACQRARLTAVRPGMAGSSASAKPAPLTGAISDRTVDSVPSSSMRFKSARARDTRLLMVPTRQSHTAAA